MSIRFERLALYDEVWNTPLTHLAKKYGLSDNGLRKVCKALNIPLPKAGHWAKLAAGYQVPKEPLPENAERTEFVSNPDPVAPVTSEQTEDQVWLTERLAFEELPENYIVVDLSPKRLHSLLVPTRDQLLKLVREADAAKKEAEKEEQRPQRARQWSPNFNSFRWKIFESRGQLLELRKRDLPFRVTPQTWERAVAIMNALLFAAEARGFQIEKGDKDNRLCFMTNDGRACIRITEKLKDEVREPNGTDPGGDNRIKVPTGILRVYVSYRWGSAEKEIAETNDEPLQGKLNEVFFRAYRAIVRDRAHQRRLDEWHRQYKEDELRRAEAEKRRLEEIQRREEESQRRIALVKEASDWQSARLIRDYLVHLDESTAIDGYSVHSDFYEWKAWALRVANELDPTGLRLKAAPEATDRGE